MPQQRLQVALTLALTLALSACASEGAHDAPAEAPAALDAVDVVADRAAPLDARGEFDDAWAYLSATYDADGDGRITPDEHGRGDASFARLDSDRDGAITPGLSALRRDEAARGLDDLGKRILMRRRP